MATDTKVNLAALFVQKGLITLAPNGGGSSKHPKIASWVATPWLSGGSAAIVLHNPDNKAEYDRVYKILKEAQVNPALGIRQVVRRDEIAARAGNPQASFFVDFKAGFGTGDDYKIGDLCDSSLTTAAPGTGTHGYLLNAEPQVQASFFAFGEGHQARSRSGHHRHVPDCADVAKLLGIALLEAKMPPLAITRPAEK